MIKKSTGRAMRHGLRSIRRSLVNHPGFNPRGNGWPTPDEAEPSRQKEGSSYTIEEYLSDKGEKGRKFWDGLVALARRCGEFQFAPAKTRSGLMLRARFVVVFTLSDRGMTFGLSMASRHEHPRFRKIDQVGAHEYFHRIRVDVPR